MRYFRNPNFISFCFLILIKPGCISGIPVLGILDTLLNMIRIMLVLFTLIVLFKNAQLLPVNRLFGVTMLVVASILWEPISTLTGGGSIADFGALMNDLGIALVCYIGLRAGYDSFIEGVAKVSGAYVLINCLTVILFPAGMYATTKYSQNFFLSYRTAWFVIYLLALTTTLLWNANVGSRFTKRFAIAVAVAATLSMILQWTATGLFCFSINEMETYEYLQSDDIDPAGGYIYGTGKLAAHLMGETVAKMTGVEFIPVIITNIYGVGEKSARMIYTAIRKLIHKEHCSFTAGYQTYDFIYITDAINAIIAVAEKGKPFNRYYIGSGEPKPLREFLLEMRDLVDPAAEIGLGDLPFKGVNVSYDQFDLKKVERDTGYVNQIPFAQGIKMTADYIREEA